MVFSHAWVLVLLLIAPAVAYLSWRARPPRRAAVALLQAATLIAFVLALANPIVATRQPRDIVVNVVDLGPAFTDEHATAMLAGLPQTGVDSPTIVFASRAEQITDRSIFNHSEGLKTLRRRLAMPLWPDDLGGGGSNLASALQLASAQIPPDARGKIRLWSSGLSHHGDAAAEAWRLAQRGVPIEIVPATASSIASPPVRVARLTISGSARVGQTVRVAAEVVSTVSGRATLLITPGSGSTITTSLKVSPGVNQATVALPLTEPGIVPIRASIRSGDGKAESGTALAAVHVRPAADVLLVQDENRSSASAALTTLLGLSVRMRPVSIGQLMDQQPEDFDAVILADVPAERVPAIFQDRLKQAVRNGTGLLLTGAARSFGPGGYDRSPLAELLPVTMPQQAENIDPSTTLVLIIDTSGSMHGERIDLAKEVARLALGHLKSHDKVGIVEFYGGKRWAAPIQSAGNMPIIQRALDRLNAGGGTTLFPAVEEAAFALRNVSTRQKHLLILSDGMVENAPFPAVIRQMAEDGITVSTGQVGPNETSASHNQMADIARWGNGRYYTIPDPYALPDIRLKQPKVSLLSPLVEQVTKVVSTPAGRFGDNGPDAVGQVSGYVRTEAKPTADVLLKTDTGDPLMVRWRYGLGFVSALPTQLGSDMAASLQGTPAFGRVLSGLIRQLDETRGEPLSVTATLRPAGVEVDVTTAAPSVNGAAPLRLSAVDENGKVVRSVSAEPIAFGHWNALFPGLTTGVYGIIAEQDQSTGHAAIAVPPPNLYVNPTDRPVLSHIESFAKLAADRAAERSSVSTRWLELRPFLAALAVLLLVGHVGVRRWPLAVK